MQTVILDYSHKEEIKKLWENDFLGVPFNSVIDELIGNKRFIGVVDDGGLIGMCGYKPMKRTNEIQIVKLCVLPEYRGLGIATKLVKVIKVIARQQHKILTAHCRDGAPNNAFYDKIGTHMRTESRKTMDVRIYVLNKI